MPTLIRDIAVPHSLLADPDRFGGRVEGDLKRGDLLISEDRVIGMTAAPPAEARIVEGRGRILLPGLVEPHLHLDKAFTLPRLPDAGGNLLAAIRAQEADKKNWTDDDLRARAGRALAELVAAGVVHARTHVDWGNGADPTAPPVPGMFWRNWRRTGRTASGWNCPACRTSMPLQNPRRQPASLLMWGGLAERWARGA
ncbi:MAG: hypothetical protein IOC80_09715 [Rhodobacter sp.]|nr:hypothetical protein [Rhodobacter sp.]MCA3511696.1 hypothetical protein [Rhodobacter sp.]MCA3520514.1 hypothetical protein [Rhodobacter sp.]MCA3523029.1 hypothetical protein [Rhodobacter sp.]MCA3526753.1 hypothetical protein [Rhodobacter sp.]